MKFQRVPWNRRAHRALNLALDGEDHLVRREVILNKALLLMAGDRSHVVFRVENGTELVVLCYQGENLKEFSETMISESKKIGLRSIRFHTRRPGMRRVMSRFGFKYVGNDARGLTVHRLELRHE